MIRIAGKRRNDTKVTVEASCVDSVVNAGRRSLDLGVGGTGGGTRLGARCAALALASGLAITVTFGLGLGFEIGLVPARALELEANRRHQFPERFLAARWADLK